MILFSFFFFFFFQAEDGIRDYKVTGVQTCALPISGRGYRQLLRHYRASGAPGQDQHQPTLRPTYQGVAQSGGGRPWHCHAHRRRDAPRRSNYTSYKVANFLVEFSTSIPRTQLRPNYGDGFLGAPLQTRQPLENPAPWEQGDQRGSSSTPRQQNSGGAHHI